MPELPEVETTRRGLLAAMEGSRFTDVRQRRANLRFTFPENFSQRLVGTDILSLDRRAKYLVAHLSSEEVLIMHLGMSGSFSVLPPEKPVAEFGKHDHVVFGFANGYTVIYNDPRRFGFMDIVASDQLETSKHLSHLGIEPLGNQLSGPVLKQLFADKKTPMKTALLDQRLIAGLGNIYVCEALFRTRIHPERPAGSLTAEEAEVLSISIRDVLNEALASGGSTLRNYSQTDGTLGYFQHQFQVYDHEGDPCPTPECKGHIHRIVQAGRSTFFCPTCQKI
ncbi:bifunctional DNA-formamidopyrimidine glycosylase/DNA-(apurinic or apyrimidinic site) lyase [Microvirga sp. W0021]|uniref:Formamidopyrimidine-DNA glycosylase n=1 Tax=Hohaiivirga grylli TaxID=3133970 RepID=A0ABV0BJH6_9HYPH